MSTIKEKIADAVLENPRTISISGREFRVAPPTCATLIAVSKLTPEAPLIEVLGDRMEEVLAVAKDSDVLFEQLAVLILGANAYKVECLPWWRRIWHKRRLHALSEWLKDNCTPKQINKAREELFGLLEVDDFFVFAAFLNGVNLIQRTRAAETMIQSGQ